MGAWNHITHYPYPSPADLSIEHFRRLEATDTLIHEPLLQVNFGH
jgi:hypothetical protein